MSDSIVYCYIGVASDDKWIPYNPFVDWYTVELAIGRNREDALKRYKESWIDYLDETELEHAQILHQVYDVLDPSPYRYKDVILDEKSNKAVIKTPDGHFAWNQPCPDHAKGDANIVDRYLMDARNAYVKEIKTKTFADFKRV